MKKLFIGLLLATAGENMSAQINTYTNPVLLSETTFSRPVSGASRTHFEFFLGNNNRMIIELRDIHQLNSLTNLDSLFKKIWVDLQPLRDSLSDPLLVRRVDYTFTETNSKIRITQYRPASNYYGYKDDELVQMKVDQDTLRFRGYTLSERQIVINGIKRYTGSEYTVMLLLNNISDVTKFPEGFLQSAISLVLKDLKGSLAKPVKKTNNSYFLGVYNLQSGKRISPLNPDRMGFGKKNGLQPYIQVGAQYGRGSWIASAGAGLEYYYDNNLIERFAFRVFWEPYFFFSRNNSNKLITERNDFISLKFHEDFRGYDKSRNDFSLRLNFSAGYLFHRKGDWFEPATFKFSLPGLQSKNVLLEPEFFFNKLFKNFSPSLKAVVYFE